MNYIVRGRVVDATSGEPVIGANVYLSATRDGTTTNIVGEYFLHLREGDHRMIISSVGYKAIQVVLTLSSDTLLTHGLHPSTAELEEVVVTGESDRVNSLRLGHNTIDLSTIKKIPPLLGEADLLRGLLLMPGVSTVGEGSSGINIRGGGVDQNLIILDDAPVFNTSHLFGFLTSFNASAVRTADLYKGSIPASYGGRASSVIDVKLKQGNDRRIAGSAGLGLMAANLTLEGPLASGKTTFLVSGRSSYSDWLLRTVPNETVSNSRAFFYDGIAKISHRINRNNLLTATGYRSYDSFRFPGDTTYSWSTNNATLKLGTTLSSRLFLMNTLVYGNYQYKVSGHELTNEFEWKAGIQYLAYKSDFSLSFNTRHKSDFGFILERYRVGSGNLVPVGDSNVNAFDAPDETGYVGAVYYSHQYDVNDRFALMAGLRLSQYVLAGPGNINRYAEGLPKSGSTFLGKEAFQENSVIERYSGVEPRLSLRYSINTLSSLKLGYDQMLQYLHLISNTSAVSPIDLWKLSDPYLKPQMGRQISAGYFRNSTRGRYTFSFETFFKRLENVVDYKDGAELLLNDMLEADLLQGEGRAYGTEWMIEKNHGKLTGWIAYTLSRSERRIKGSFDEETVNKGEYYPANYDKLHNLSVTASYQKNERITWGFNFTLATGRPITFPASSYSFGGVRVANYENRNNERGPAYHRLDLSVEIRSKPRPERKWKSAVVISVYNAYARRNPYSVFFRSEHFIVAQSFRLAVIGTAVPSVSYTITF